MIFFLRGGGGGTEGGNPPFPRVLYETLTVKFKVSVVAWQHQNEASIHRQAMEFADDRKHVREWCQCYSILKGQTC